MNLEDGRRFLADSGLNLSAVLETAALPQPAATVMADSGVPLTSYRRLVLIGHGGRRMWDALSAFGMRTADPVDTYSTSITRRFIRDYLDEAPVLWLYPQGPYTIPLQQLGQAAGWSHPSPLGSGISPVYGVWFAYRAAFLINADLPLAHSEPAPAPCLSCIEKSCIRSCPAGAVQMDTFGLDSCAHYRLYSSSPCADRCLARLACPYFPEHRYGETQIQYHYGRSLDMLRAWYEK